VFSGGDWRVQSSGMGHHSAWLKFTDVSEEGSKSNPNKRHSLKRR
jgi:hypothetical protein